MEQTVGPSLIGVREWAERFFDPPLRGPNAYRIARETGVLVQVGERKLMVSVARAKAFAEGREFKPVGADRG